MFEVHRLLYHSTLGLKVIKKKKKVSRSARDPALRLDIFEIWT